jgi:fumarylacetoacetate (FAA) hydrolase
VAVTPDELGDAWQGGRVHLPLQQLERPPVGLTDAGPEGMNFHFGQLIAHLAKTRRCAPAASSAAARSATPTPASGWSCIAEKRALETIEAVLP